MKVQVKKAFEGFPFLSTKIEGRCMKIFAAPSFLQYISTPTNVRIKKMVNERSIDDHPSP